ncbi:hypothetical protein FEM48_Zijuj03G0092100 [Ziziphus jujuba var. spinosa]|uniref:Large ribosomal RNA subunit accumulation protein YCED homolog 1, chloroplastic n=1 Tax=Ziziphus jujuba var. spinosa TaxID=714518 RepID=A0A978VPF6_ZIZJJ|nr:hypothetical protein FEM48_Zijuj03G0092100 [Ziziphus jujuba var. spinosa]
MSLVCPSFVVPSSFINHYKVYFKPYGYTSPFPYFAFGLGKNRSCLVKGIPIIVREKEYNILRSTKIDCMKPNYQPVIEENEVSFHLGDQEKDDMEDTDSPWEGAVIYKRSSSISHLEYCTTLERLGLGKLSTEVSKSRASVMGLRITRSVKDYPLGTPVQISVDVTKKKQKLRLDGIIKTVITLGCNRCGEPTAECIFSNFSLLLTEEPVEEPDIINMGIICGGDKVQSYAGIDEEGVEDDESSIDLEDWLYFPPEEKEIDISKHIRDLVHLEITINAVCDPNCKGLCLKCGINLNTKNCNCSKKEVEKKGYGPLGDLKKQMQTK